MNESSQGMHGTDLSCAQETKQVMSNLTGGTGHFSWTIKRWACLEPRVFTLDRVITIGDSWVILSKYLVKFNFILDKDWRL